jgi:hypothetical protein
MKFDPEPNDATYARLGKLVDDLDSVISSHIRKHGDKEGTSDAFNAACAVLAGVVQGVADFDRDVFDKLSGAINYHIYCQASQSGERGEYKIQ